MQNVSIDLETDTDGWYGLKIYKNEHGRRLILKMWTEADADG